MCDFVGRTIYGWVWLDIAHRRTESAIGAVSGVAARARGGVWTVGLSSSAVRARRCTKLRRRLEDSKVVLLSANAASASPRRLSKTAREREARAYLAV